MKHFRNPNERGERVLAPAMRYVIQRRYCTCNSCGRTWSSEGVYLVVRTSKGAEWRGVRPHAPEYNIPVEIDDGATSVPFCTHCFTSVDVSHLVPPSVDDESLSIVLGRDIKAPPASRKPTPPAGARPKASPVNLDDLL